MKMEKKVILTVAIFFILAVAVFIGKSFLFWGRVIQIDDVTRKASIVLAGRENVHAMRMLITGRIDGQVTIRQKYLDKDAYKYELGAGEVNFPITTDWYNHTCVIEYEPKGVKTGNLQIRYEFKS